MDDVDKVTTAYVTENNKKTFMTYLSSQHRHKYECSYCNEFYLLSDLIWVSLSYGGICKFCLSEKKKINKKRC